MSASIVVVAALEREVLPLVKRWPVFSDPSLGAYRSFANGDVLVVCAGIGSRPVRKSVESVLSRFRPELLISAGLAGALVPELKVGQVIIPATIVDSATGQRISTGQGSGTLTSAPGVAGPEGKRLLARKYAAQVVDMEAWAVAEVAADSGIPFIAVKAISDECEFPVPGMDKFVARSGRFLTGKFLCHIALRPNLWPVVRQLNLNSDIASQQLCAELRNLIHHATRQPAIQLPLAPGTERKTLAR